MRRSEGKKWDGDALEGDAKRPSTKEKRPNQGGAPKDTAGDKPSHPRGSKEDNIPPPQQFSEELLQQFPELFQKKGGQARRVEEEEEGEPVAPQQRRRQDVSPAGRGRGRGGSDRGRGADGSRGRGGSHRGRDRGGTDGGRGFGRGRGGEKDVGRHQAGHQDRGGHPSSKHTDPSKHAHHEPTVTVQYAPGSEADELLAAEQTTQKLESNRKQLPAHRPFVLDEAADASLMQSIAEGRVAVGVLSVFKKWNSAVCFCRNPEAYPVMKDFMITDRGDALSNDIVAVELAPLNEWRDRVEKPPEDRAAPLVQRASGGKVKNAVLPDGTTIKSVVKDTSRQGGGRQSATPLGRINQALHVQTHPSWPENRQPVGKVFRVLQRQFERLQACRLVIPPGRKANPNFDFQKFKPYNETYPHVVVRKDDIPGHLRSDLHDLLLLVEIKLGDDGMGVEFEQHGSYSLPVGRVVMSLGKQGTVLAESRAITELYNVKDAEFSPEVEECVQQDFVMPSAEELAKMGRRDLRDTEFVCTIDPATARDLDDALSITRTPHGYRVGVHIADVSHFVPLDSELDLEARQRATSCYLVDRVIPMLPRRLSEEYCSLDEGGDKFAFSVIWEMDNNAEIKSEWFGQSVIRNSCRMAYEDAQLIIEGDRTGDHLANKTHAKKVVNSVMMLFEVAKKLRNRRYDKGALSLNKAKLWFMFEDFNSRLAPKGYGSEVQREANWLVEEMMLLANFRVAQKLVEYLPQSAMLRQHSPPQSKKVCALIPALDKFGIKINFQASKALNNSLQAYDNHPDRNALRLMVTYCMSLAQYCCGGDDEVKSIAHYALAAPCYTHFTSPIRRYADLVVHRMLLLALDIEHEYRKSNGELDEIKPENLPHGRYYWHEADVSTVALHCNEKKESAKKASDASSRLFLCMYLDALTRRERVQAGNAQDVGRHFAEAVVTKMGEGTFVLYAGCLNVDVELLFNGNNGIQLWENIEVVENEEEESEESRTVIQWGDGEEEDLVLFKHFVIELKVVRKAHIDVDYVVLPPRERARRAGQLGVPTEL